LTKADKKVERDAAACGKWIIYTPLRSINQFAYQSAKAGKLAKICLSVNILEPLFRVSLDS
jgi:hypothetical protein